ncbi:LPXTG cell wall anchor domain-containing protein [Lactococcus lactis]|nr:LPXTG cell wall anchor domain-containing protein [Lactococcus lactis]
MLPKTGVASSLLLTSYGFVLFLIIICLKKRRKKKKKLNKMIKFS